MDQTKNVFLDSETDALTKSFFASQPQAYPLFVAIGNLIVANFKEITVKIQKTQIAFASKRNFAFVWFPPFPIKNRPDVYVVFSFGNDIETKNPRIIEAKEVSPKRWIHHVLISKLEDVDAQMLAWLKISYRATQP